MEENGIPIAPAILGLVLGELLEQSFMTSMIKADGMFMVFFQRPIAATLGVITILLWAGMLWHSWRRKPVVSAAPASPPA
jgi:TctA family transporter